MFRTAAASRRGPTGELGVAALDRAASEARAAAADIPEWDARQVVLVAQHWARDC